MEADRTVQDAEWARRGSPNAGAQASEDDPAAKAAAASNRSKSAGRRKEALAPLYKRLPHGPHGLKREEVVSNQSNRIRGAMIESVYQCGYVASTVADVVALAGVSRRAFYEHFSSKEDCFLSTFDLLIKASRKRVLRAFLSERGRANRLRAACHAFLAGVARDPRGSYLMLVEAIDAGPHPGQCLRRTIAGFERVVATGFGIAPDHVAPELPVPRAIVGGIRFVLARRLREGRHAEIAGLTGGLLDWLGSYRPGDLARLRTPATALPPRQIAAGARLPARDERRSRAMAALVKLSTQRGYPEIADADVARAAKISTEAFHREFANKQDCLLAILDELAADLHDAIQRATRGEQDWPQATYKGVQALLGYCAAHPDLMRLALLDVIDTGQIKRASGLLDGFMNTMTSHIPAPERAPNIAAEAIAGAVWAILASHVQPDRLQRLPSLTAHISYLVIAPYTGSEAAVEAIEAAQTRPRRLAAR